MNLFIGVSKYNDTPHTQFLQVWIDYYRQNEVSYVKNMTKLGYDLIYVKLPSGVIHAIVLNPAIIDVREVEHDIEKEELNELRNFIRKAIIPICEDKKIKVKGFHSNIEKDTIENNDFRKILYTSKHLQLGLMSLKQGEEIGEEIHENIDQFFRFESGHGKCIINGNEYNVKNGDVIIVPAGSKHNVINTSDKIELKMYTIYTPPKHKDKIINSTKKEAEIKDADFDGKTTENLVK